MRSRYITVFICATVLIIFTAASIARAESNREPNKEQIKHDIEEIEKFVELIDVKRWTPYQGVIAIMHICDNEELPSVELGYRRRFITMHQIIESGPGLNNGKGNVYYSKNDRDYHFYLHDKNSNGWAYIVGLNPFHYRSGILGKKQLSEKSLELLLDASAFEHEITKADFIINCASEQQNFVPQSFIQPK